MQQKKRSPIRPTLWSLVGLLCGVTAACNSNAASKDPGSKSADPARDDSSAHVDILCVTGRISNPPEPFHYSYKYSGTGGSTDSEAEVTPQRIDTMSKDPAGSRSYHGVRSNEESWNAAILGLSSLRFTGLSARIDSLNGTSALVRQGTESVNGYNTTKYSIDTTRSSSSDKQQFETLFNKGSFEKGTLWAPADGCAVKLVLDEAIVQNDGSVDKAHYELALAKK